MPLQERITVPETNTTIICKQKGTVKYHGPFSVKKGNRNMLKKIVLWCMVVLLSCGIFSFSGDSGPESDAKSGKITTFVAQAVNKVVRDADYDKVYSVCHVLIRKTAHFSIYMLLAILSYALGRSYELRMQIAALCAATYCLLFAVSDEIHQLFVPYRSGQITDVCIDFLGACLGIGISCQTEQLLKKEK